MTSKWFFFFLFLSQLLLHGRSYLPFSQSIKLASIWLSYLKFFFHLVQLLKVKMIIFYPGLELFKLAIPYLLKFFSSLDLRLYNSSVPSPVTAPSYFYSLALFTFHFNCTKIPLLCYLLFSLYSVSFCMAATTTNMLTTPTSSFPVLTSYPSSPYFYLPIEFIIFPIKPTLLDYHTLQTTLKVSPKLEI